MAENITISRYAFGGIWVLIAVLVIVILVCLVKLRDKKAPLIVEKPEIAWIQDGTIVPIDAILKNFLQEEKVYSLVLLKADGRFRWVDPSGQEFEICGTINKGRIEGERCGLEGKKVSLTTFMELTVLGTEGSDCTLGQHQGKIAWIHRNPPGHTYPCHH